MTPLLFYQMNLSIIKPRLFSELFNAEKIYNGTSLESYIGWGGKDGLLRLLKTNETV